MQLRYYLYPLIAVSIWAGNNLVGKLSVDVIAPAPISFFRWAVAALILTPFILPSIWKERQKIQQHLGQLIILAALGIVAFQSLAYIAAAHTSASNMGFIGAIVPLLTVLLSLLLNREVPSIGAILGSALSFVGLTLLLSGGNPSQLLSQGVNSGDALLLIGALAYALYGVLIKRWVLPLTTWQSLYMQIVFGLLWLLPATWFSPSMEVGSEAVPMILYAGIAASVVAPYCWMKGITALGTNKNALFMNLVPVLTCLAAVPVLKDVIERHHWLGGGLVLVGVTLALNLNKPLWRNQQKASSL